MPRRSLSAKKGVPTTVVRVCGVLFQPPMEPHNTAPISYTRLWCSIDRTGRARPLLSHHPALLHVRPKWLVIRILFGVLNNLINTVSSVERVRILLS